ncbi:MAG: Hsp20/alpha crystallin family protein [Chloroflexi bacterium]|nr:Hsp20/alpha crystallin family protein [Chloroflexota bacterium]
MKKKAQQDVDLSNLLGGTLNIFGFKVDLAKLLSSPEDVTGQLERLRARLKELGLKETLSDEEWKSGAAGVSGHIRIRGIAGEEEYHIGTSGGRRPRAKEEKAAEPPEVVEPPLDLFEDPEGLTIVADMPGVSLEDLDLKIDGRILTIATSSTARRVYRKVVQLGHEVDPESFQTTCHNGVLEIRLRKRA